MQGGVNGELNIGKLVGKRLHVIGTALRGRPVRGAHGKSAIVDAVVASVWPMIGDGLVRPIVGARYPIQQAADAHRALATGEYRQGAADRQRVNVSPATPARAPVRSTSPIVE